MADALDTSWKDHAACQDDDPAVFYPESGDPRAGEAAKAVCASCPVQQHCLEYALAHRDKHGIWGGTNERERRRILRQRRQGATVA